MLFDDMTPILAPDAKEPKYNQLARQIESYLTERSVPTGTRLPSERLLADLFGIAPVTVGRSLNELVQRGVLERKVGSGTYLADRRRLRRIGIFCHEPANISDYYTGCVLSVIHEYFRESGVDLLSLTRRNDAYTSTIHEYQLDGIIVLAVQEDSIPVIRRLRDSEFPIVTIGVTFPELSDLGFGTDHTMISGQAADYLIRRGYRRIGFLSGTKFSSIDVRERERGYCKAMYEAGLPVDPDWIIRSESRKAFSWIPKMRDLLGRPDHPDAFLLACHNDIIPVYNLMNEMNLRIPEDISLVAFDDPPYAQHLSPPLTVFGQPVREFTRQAVRQLENMVMHRPPETFGPSSAVVAERGSCLSRKTNMRPKRKQERK